MSLRIPRWIAPAMLVIAGSCSDLLSPRAPKAGSALTTIDVSVATVSLDILYNGVSIGQSFAPPGVSITQGDRCFNVLVDGVFRTNTCGAVDVQNLAPGTHTIGLQDVVPMPGNPIGTPVDVAPPVSVNLAGGTSTPVSFDISAIRGKVAALVQIKGATPQSFQYKVCIEGGSCGDLVNGVVSLFVRPGAGTVHVRAMAAFSNILDIPFTGDAGHTVDLGTFNIQFGSLAVDVLYDGASIGPSFAPPGQTVPQGDRCFQLYVDGVQRQNVCGPTTIADVAPGDHIVALKDIVPMPGNPIGNPVDVQPPVTVTVVSNTAAPVAFDISAIRGQISATVQINGGPPPSFQYNVCLDNGSCGDLGTGSITLFVRPGTGVAHVRSMVGFTTILDIPFTGVAGETADLGTFNVQFGSLAVDVLYNGASIGQNFAPPGQTVAQGERCFQLYVDNVQRQSICGPTTINDVAPGAHTVALKDLIQVPGNPIGTTVDVQPPVSVSVSGGASTPVSFDITTIRGKISGEVRINGAVPPSLQYQVCVGQSSCGDLINGQFVMFARVGSGTGTLRSFAQFTTLAQFTFIVAAGNTTLIGGVSTADPGSTPPGSNVSVLPVNQTTGTSNTTIELTFSNVTSPGTTTVVQSNTGAPPPTGLQLGTPPVYFNISSTATFSGPVEVCINYTGTTFDPGAPLELLHGESDGSWTVVTTSLDETNRIICGSVSSFSPFVVARRTAAPAIPPSVTPVVSGTLGANDWYTSNVAVTWNISGNGSTITNKTGCDDATISSNTSGTTLACTATSAGGSTPRSVTIKRDATAPTVTPHVSGPAGNNGWYRGDVSVSFTVSTPISGITSAPCSSSTLTADSQGAEYSCSATSGSGLNGFASTTVKRDATNPVVAYANNAGTYQLDQQVHITCSATDATSGIESSTCADITGPAYSFGPGATTRSASATDNAGNSSSATASFTVTVTAEGLCRLTTSLAPELSTSLCAKLNAAAAARARGNAAAADGQLRAYANELRAEAGKKISTESAEMLIRLAAGM